MLDWVLRGGGGGGGKNEGMRWTLVYIHVLNMYKHNNQTNAHLYVKLFVSLFFFLSFSFCLFHCIFFSIYFNAVPCRDWGKNTSLLHLACCIRWQIGPGLQGRLCKPRSRATAGVAQERSLPAQWPYNNTCWVYTMGVVKTAPPSLKI